MQAVAVHILFSFSRLVYAAELLPCALFQVLLRLCRQPFNVERLVETQELQCLIIGLTSLWDQTSAAWRHQASCVLKAVSAVATSNTVQSLLGYVRFSDSNLLFLSVNVECVLLVSLNT